MVAACEAEWPASIAVMSAAVADWRPDIAANNKIKKEKDAAAPVLKLVENPDILATLARHARPPSLRIGFAAEPGTVVAHAPAKLPKKGCDWTVANEGAPTPGWPAVAATSWDRARPRTGERLATTAFDVPSEGGHPLLVVGTGSLRSNSSAALIPSEPGRVDSPPTSTIAAPQSSIPHAAVTAGSTRRWTPASENESGVTLITPITAPGGNRSSIRCRVDTFE